MKQLLSKTSYSQSIALKDRKARRVFLRIVPISGMAGFGILLGTYFCALPEGITAAAAVAWSEEAYGYSFNAKSIEEAEAIAKAAAIKNGSDPDKVEILATSKVVGYGAIAVDGNIVGVTIGYPDLRAAIVRARQECIKRGGKFPRVVATWHDRGY
jgi:hypothetical protein